MAPALLLIMSLLAPAQRPRPEQPVRSPVERVSNKLVPSWPRLTELRYTSIDLNLAARRVLRQSPILHKLDAICISRVDIWPHLSSASRVDIWTSNNDLVALRLPLADDVLLAVRTPKGWVDSVGYSMAGPFAARPIQLSRLTSSYGARYHPIAKDLRHHFGVDYGAPTGTPVYSIGDGVVVAAGFSATAGNFITLRHSNEFVSKYMHLHRIESTIKAGVRVRRAARIGQVGSTGSSTAPHLHFELHEQGRAQDPLRQYRPSSGRLSLFERIALQRLITQLKEATHHGN